MTKMTFGQILNAIGCREHKLQYWMKSRKIEPIERITPALFLYDGEAVIAQYRAEKGHEKA